MVKKKPTKKTKKKKTLFDRAKIEFLNYDEFLKIFAEVSKRVVSEKVSSIQPFPKIIQLSASDEDCNYSPEFLRKLRDYFDNTKSINSLSNKIIVSEGGKIISDKTQSKRNLAKKKILLNRILNDAILKAESQYKEKNKKNKNSKKVYAGTIKSSMITYPPGRIGEKRFNAILDKLEEKDREKLKTIYKFVDGYYCGQRRIHKKNYKEIAEIFFNLKHIENENK